MEIQKKLWTYRHEKRALSVAFVHTCALTACADPGIFVKGGGGAENSMDTEFMSLHSYTLFELNRTPAWMRSQWLNNIIYAGN